MREIQIIIVNKWTNINGTSDTDISQFFSKPEI
jgi:hypothetical protein